MTSEQVSGAPNSLPGDASRTAEASSVIKFVEPIDWVAKRLFHRGGEAIQESDHDERGIVTVLRWLAADEYVFEEKYRTFIVASPQSASLREYSIVAEQLARLRYRCRVILTEGRDPGEGQPFTCLVPNRTAILETVGNAQSTKQSEVLCQMFRAMLVDGNGEGVEADEMHRRFELTGSSIQEVARWIARGEFDATRQIPVNA